jgi:hypothetical protein
MTDVLEVLEVPHDLQVEGHRSSPFGELLGHWRRLRVGVPARSVTDSLGEPNDGIRLQLSRPMPDHAVGLKADDLVTEPQAVSQPAIAEGSGREGASPPVDAGGEGRHTSSSPFLAAIS